MKPTVSDRMTRRPDGRRSPRMVGIERGEQLVARGDLGAGQRVEQRGFAGVGVADQGDHRERHAPAGVAVQAAGAAHLLQLLLQPHDAVADQPPVGLDLGFAGAAEEAEAAALPLQMGPGPHQAGALIVEMRQLDLQRAFARGRPLAEDVQDQAGAVDHLAGPGAFQVALLHRRQRGIDDRRRVTSCSAIASPCVATWPCAEQRRGAAGAQRQDRGVHDHEPDGGGEADRFGQPRLGGARLRRRRVRHAPRAG